MSTSTPSAPEPRPSRSTRSSRRRVALAGAVGALALVGGAGVAYAASLDQPVETGYATVVDEASPSTGETNGNRPAGDCPERADGSQNAPESAAPSTQAGDI